MTEYLAALQEFQVTYQSLQLIFSKLGFRLRCSQIFCYFLGIGYTEFNDRRHHHINDCFFLSSTTIS